MKTPNMILALTAGVALSASQAALAQYNSGDAWHRASDWAPGVLHGSTFGNPGPGFDGVGVWRYEYATGGGGLGADNPWYQQSTTLLSWDNNWWGNGFGAWTAGDDRNPPIRQDRMTHNLVGTHYETTPLVRWLLPTGAGDLALSLTGSFDVLWTGHEFRGTDIDVELVVARQTAGGEFDVLFTDRLSKPTPGVSVGDRRSSMVDISSVIMSEGDSLVISGRGVSSVGWTEGRWLSISDDLTMTVVPIPAPASLALLGLGGLAAMRRRR
ncbi:MAG: PEP-CTERM sorting domain-containing protein [Phycisphaeraceae bacterium]|nr:PEP-CTERM sorting domain-containing protein [Phycisphaeraceae bacterium]